MVIRVVVLAVCGSWPISRSMTLDCAYSGSWYMVFLGRGAWCLLVTQAWWYVVFLDRGAWCLLVTRVPWCVVFLDRGALCL